MTTKQPTYRKPTYRTDDELRDFIGALTIQHQLELFGESRSSDVDANLSRLHDAGVIEAEARRCVALDVRLVRKHGATWAQIGEALGVSRQAAQQRFGAAGEP